MQHNQTIDNAVAAVTFEDESVPGRDGKPIRVRVYRSGAVSRSAPLVLHLHGGSFVAGSLDNGRVVSMLLSQAGAVVASVDYPLAPRHPFPQALELAFDVLTFIARGQAKWAGRKPRLYVAGEEAGGNLAAALALMARDQRAPLLSGQILLSPMVDPKLATCSVREAKAGPAECQWAAGWHGYLGSAAKAAHPYASPIVSSRLSGVVPALLVSAEDDLLRDETLNYANRLRESGVPVRQHVLPAPTGWPCALFQGVDQETPWKAALRARIAEFFADTRSSSASLLHSVEA
jgi:acetyl esterase/lipase